MSAFVINPYSFGIQYSYLAAYTDSANLTTYTFNSVDFGAADNDRHIVIAFMSRSGSNIDVSSATIGGVTATIDAKTTASLNHSAILRANVTSGTSGTVAVTLNTGSLRAAIGVYRIVKSGLVVSGTDVASGTSSASVTLDTGNGAVIAAAADNQTTISFTNVTGDASGTLEVLTYASGSGSTNTGTLTVTATGANAVRLAAASYS